VNLCWSFFKWGLLLVAVGVAATAAYYYHHIQDEIRARVEAKLAAGYPDLKVTVRSARLVEGEGIEVRGVSIVEPGAEGPAELLYFDELMIRCTTDLERLLAEDLEMREIVIRRPMFRASRRPDGSYGTARLLPFPQFSRQPPPITIENGTIEVFDPQKNPSSTLTLRDVNLTLGVPEASAGQEGAPRKLRGTMTGDHLRQVELDGVFDPMRESSSLGGTIHGLDISPDLCRALPGPFAEKLAGLGELRGQATLRFRVTHDPTVAAEPQWEAAGEISRGRLDDSRLPHPLTDMQVAFRLDGRRLVIDKLAAGCGSAAVEMSYCQEGFEAASPRTLQGRVRQLELNPELVAALPDCLKQQWQRYRPYGMIDLEAKFAFDGRVWHPDVVARCADVSFLHDKFPYRLDHGQGVVQCKDDTLEIHLTATGGNQPVLVDARVRQLTSAPVGWCEVKGDELELDEKLFEAMPERSREVVRSLHPRGTINFRMYVAREAADQPTRKHLEIGLNRCSIRYERFPYPITGIQGTLEMVDDRWAFRDLVGNNDTGRVLCEGYLVPDAEGHELLLRFAATDVPLEAELRDAFNPNIRRVWDDLRPSGTVDLHAEVRYLPGPKKLQVGVRAKPQSETASICPVRFPYRLEKLQGELVYDDGHVTLERFRAEHGAVKVSGTGYCDFLPVDGWRLRFEGFNVDRLRLDRDLVQTMPPRLRKAVAKLDPRGPISLRGTVELFGTARESDPVRSAWDLDVGFQQGTIDCGVKLENMYGSVRLTGDCDGVRFQSRGELAVDSLTYKDFQFTEVRGPIWIDDARVLLGSSVDRQPAGAAASGKQPPQPRSLTGKLFGGSVHGDGWVELGAGPRYRLQAGLARGNLTQCAQEVMPGKQNLRGNLMASLDLYGDGPTRNSMLGGGVIQLREANVYELPLMIALLKLLSIRPPDQNAFSSSDIHYRIVGEHVYFDRINFTGDAISLLGKGEMDFQQAIRLRFYPIVGRGDLGIPVVKELFHGASQQFMLIYVGGTLQNPETRREVFPTVNQALQQLSDDLQMTPRPADRLPEPQWLMPKLGRR
jgi:hypothetical protein